MALAKTIPENPRRFLPNRSVLLVTDSPEGAGRIAHEVNARGFNCLTTVFTNNQLQGVPRQSPDAILLNFAQISSPIGTVIKALKSRYSGKNVPIIGIFPEDIGIDTSLFDSVLFEPVHPSQIAHRVSAMIRLTIMQTETAIIPEFD